MSTNILSQSLSVRRLIVVPLILALLTVTLFGLPNLVQADSSYTVKSGDNLTKIAKANGTTIEALVAANKAKFPCLATNAACLQVGWVITIPGGSGTVNTANTPSTYTVQAGDSLSKIAKKLGVDFNALIAANKKDRPCLAAATPCALQIGWVLNVPGGAGSAPAVVTVTPAPTVAASPTAQTASTQVPNSGSIPTGTTGIVIVDNQSKFDASFTVWGPADRTFGAAAGQSTTTELPVGDYGWTSFLNGCQLLPVGNLPVTPFFTVKITILNDDSPCGAWLTTNLGF